MTQFQVHKTDLTQNRLITPAESTTIQKGEVKVKVEAFSFTANNITYWAMGDKLKYWQFFPAAQNEGHLYGIIPVWGFAEVIESKNADVPVGERLFGYFPTATEWVMRPLKVKESSWLDGAEHRAALPAGYNVYRRVDAEPGYDASQDDLRMLLFPLHITSFCLHDMLVSQQYFDAAQIVIISASSKTSLGLAFALHEDDAALEVVGITSPGNQAFIGETGYYSSCINYGQLHEIDASKKTVLVDMSGNGEVIAALHRHLGENMMFSSHVGLTHWSENQMQVGFIEARSQMFFAPSHIEQRYADWGPAAFESKATQFMQRAAIDSSRWLVVKQLHSLEQLQAHFKAISQGKLPPQEGLVIKL
ncbi:DUF2855 family protein [Marinicella sp. S1101]|uniref:DUF2855 family protein n=1 Tax=Marinicella marina TaxID=2996016 RepID=UPI0022608A5A|nr:DUF2855 family protein [Marinicella marina]MCX7554981.1 DUF2855 family protein [Marinicella marina]MDJ1141591.1 DUF2855 family protein [Marinicella marina]